MNRKVLYPLATALWLYRNTKLSVKQICDFCSINEATLITLDFENVVKPQNPIDIEQLSLSNISKCEKNADMPLVSLIKVNAVKKRLSPEQRKSVPNVIAWLKANQFPVDIKSLSTLFLITKNKWNNIIENLHQYEMMNPVMIGICTREELDKLKNR